MSNGKGLKYLAGADIPKAEGEAKPTADLKIPQVEKELDLDGYPGGVASLLETPINYRTMGGIPGETTFHPSHPKVDWFYGEGDNPDANMSEKIDAVNGKMSMTECFFVKHGADDYSKKPLADLQPYLTPFPLTYRVPSDLKVATFTFSIPGGHTHKDVVDKLLIKDPHDLHQSQYRVAIRAKDTQIANVLGLTVDELATNKVLIHKIYLTDLASNLKVDTDTMLFSHHPTRPAEHLLQWFSPDGASVTGEGLTHHVVPAEAQNRDVKCLFSTTTRLNDPEAGRYLSVDFEELQKDLDKCTVTETEGKLFNIRPDELKDWIAIKIATDDENIKNIKPKHKKLPMTLFHRWFVWDQTPALRQLCESPPIHPVFDAYTKRQKANPVKDFVRKFTTKDKNDEDIHKYVVFRPAVNYLARLKEVQFGVNHLVMAPKDLELRVVPLEGDAAVAQYEKLNKCDGEHYSCARFTMRLKFIYEHYTKATYDAEENSNDINIFGQALTAGIKAKEGGDEEQKKMLKMLKAFMAKFPQDDS